MVFPTVYYLLGTVYLFHKHDPKKLLWKVIFEKDILRFDRCFMLSCRPKEPPITKAIFENPLVALCSTVLANSSELI